MGMSNPNVYWFRSGLAIEAHRLLYHSAQGSRPFRACNESKEEEALSIHTSPRAQGGAAKQGLGVQPGVCVYDH